LGPDYIQNRREILRVLQDDLNTPKSLMILSWVTDQQKAAILKDDEPEFKDFLIFIDEILGLNLLESEDITKEQKELIQKREESRKNQDFAKSDEIRNTLKEQGIEIRDTDYGSIWNRT